MDGPLAGDELNVADIIRTLKTVIGHKPWVAPIPTFVAKMMMPTLTDDRVLALPRGSA